MLGIFRKNRYCRYPIWTLMLFIAGSVTDITSSFAQTAGNVICDGCVGSKDIQDKSIRPGDLAPGVIVGRTFLVRSNGTPSANCSSLRSALGLTATASSPVQIRLQAGTYDCGTSPLVLKSFFSLEGAGPGGTTIRGKVIGGDDDNAVVNAAAQSSISGVTIVHQINGNARAIGVRKKGGYVSLRDVSIRIDSTTSFQVNGVVAIGGTLDLFNVRIHINSANGEGHGIDGRSGAVVNMTNVWIDSSATAGNPAALQLIDSKGIGFGIMLKSPFFAIVAFGNSIAEMTDGTLIGGVAGGSGFTGSFTCTAIADSDFTARTADCN